MMPHHWYLVSLENLMQFFIYLRKQCILSESRFDFLKDLVKALPDVSGLDDEVPTPPQTPAPIQVNPLNTAILPNVTQHSELELVLKLYLSYTFM